ncbi:MAG: acyl-CoA dehydrogenase [Nevskiaceae bacterium]|nr:MAG: acyl-CoA dehydrogenase [Nevskiaceae bacterium]TAM27041.1 MAG: acyl-CoA dehydrogenase [Nevskiaceae bacterium]
MTELIQRRDLDFLLHEWLQIETLNRHHRYSGQDRATYDGVIDAATVLAEEQFLPHAAKLDANEPHFDGERVHLIPEVKAALDAYIEGGFLGTAFDTEYGGLQLPYTIFQAVSALFTAANIGTSGYLFLTGAAANLLRAHGTSAQRKTYMEPMLAGRWFGTMCLSEPQAGSSLGDIKTRATPLPDGGYAISGNKMWISGGEHDLSENIVHHVLARIDGAPAGVKGISLFIVPKYRVNADGSLGAKNGVRLMGLNHKMGYRGTTNTALSFGEQGDCVGELVGAPGQGLACMFHMITTDGSVTLQ